MALTPCLSFAFLDSVNKGLNSVSDTANNVSKNAQKTRQNIDDATNMENYKLKESDVDLNKLAKDKIDQHTNNSYSDTVKTIDNAKQTKKSLNNTASSFKSLFS